jgi:hypothetical protein
MKEMRSSVYGCSEVADLQNIGACLQQRLHSLKGAR